MVAKTESRDEGGPRSGGRVLTSIVSLIHESASPCRDDAGSTCNTIGLRYENSDDERTLQSAKLTASLHRDAMLHGTSNQLFPKKLSTTGPTTGDGKG